MKSRRQLMQAAAGAAAVFPILNAQQPVYKPKWATAAELKLLGELCDIIIPRTDTPGASDARVPEWIDFTLNGDAPRQAALREALQLFGPLNATARSAKMKQLSLRPKTKEGRSFSLLKDLTIDGYYQSREGLVTELGWHGNTYLPEFKGCTHPEHQG